MCCVLVLVGSDWCDVLVVEVQVIVDEDLVVNCYMGVLGVGLIEVGSGVLIYCNIGLLVIVGFGIVFGVICVGMVQYCIVCVFVGEICLWLQGVCLIVWELQQDGIDVILIVDLVVLYLMKIGVVQWVIVGVDCICVNGDIVNKIGMYQFVIVVCYYGVKVMVVVLFLMVDMDIVDGDQIEIEQCDFGELYGVGGVCMVVEGIVVWNLVFDVILGVLIDVIVIECGVILNLIMVNMWVVFREVFVMVL